MRLHDCKRTHKPRKQSPTLLGTSGKDRVVSDIYFRLEKHPSLRKAGRSVLHGCAYATSVQFDGFFDHSQRFTGDHPPLPYLLLAPQTAGHKSLKLQAAGHDRGAGPTTSGDLQRDHEPMVHAGQFSTELRGRARKTAHPTDASFLAGVRSRGIRTDSWSVWSPRIS